MRSCQNAVQLIRPLLSTSTSISPLTRSHLGPWPISIRHASSARRTKKKLRVPPAESMTITPDSPKTSHVIFNPPPSTPNPYNTPTLFLPRSDARYQLLQQNAKELGLEAAKANEQLPRPVRGPPVDPNAGREKEYHLTEQDVEKIRKLRLSNPVKYSRRVLAQMFNCDNLFVAMICSLPKETQEKKEKVMEVIRMRWGKLRREAREDRARRREDWVRG